MNEMLLEAPDLLDSVGQSGEPVVRSWTEKDVMLYNLTIGAGQKDAGAELNLTTENSPEATLQVVPSFACTLASAPWPERFAPDMTTVVHVEETITLEGPLPTSGTCSAQMTVRGVTGHRAGTVFHLESEVTDHSSGRVLARVGMGLLVRGLDTETAEPDNRQWDIAGEPEQMFSAVTTGNQALLYRLNGDRNPLHSSPQFARKAGFDRPILHGLCTLGISTRLLTGHYSPQDPAEVRGISGSFRKPVFPGDQLTVETWEADGYVLFRTVNQDGKVVVDRGRLELR